MQRNIVHVVGTGTIGEPLIGMLSSLRKQFGIDEVTFHKASARVNDRAKVQALQRKGAVLAATPATMEGFKKLGIIPAMTHLEAIERARVVIDCTPIGNKNKEDLYAQFDDGSRVFVAQGSEFGFGKPYARGINDVCLNRGEDRFIQVVSCNTHNIGVLLKTIAGVNGGAGMLESARFLCLRRATDISEGGNFIPSPEVGAHSDERFGTHHARDAYHLFKTMGHELDLFSSAMKLNTQYMHAIHFDIRLNTETNVEEVIRRLRDERRVSVSQKQMACEIFSFGRDHGFYGRILNQTVVSLPTLHVRNGNEVLGFCFTPQDGNSLLSSISVALWHLHDSGWDERMRHLREYHFPEI
ncbi:MAG: glyceraldehyde-3-phosphate dehydrogenase/erythrose-4-phosphate dehydrogenase [Myxococcota bacterium]|jgi:glyceraldehyde-3-phosphate dehydrogenase/erythrose-4-phosphate dehydrogenase